MDASALPPPPPLDADTLEFLQDLVVDDDDDNGDSAAHHDGGSAVSLLLLPDQQPQPHQAATGPLGGVDDALALSPLDFFPLSDDESASSASSGAAHSHAPTKAAAHTTNTTTTTTTTLKAKRKKPNRSPNYDPNRARNMRRHELIYLREKVAEMEQELARLRDASALQLTAPRATSVALAPVPAPLPLVPVGGIASAGGALEASSSKLQARAPGEAVWERIAARQLSERQRAERENERLKIVLETQLKIAKSLEHLLHKRTTMQGFDACGLGRQRRVFACAPSASDVETFESLLEQVHACYLDADKHFESFGIGASEASCRDARIRDGVDPTVGDSGGLHMEIFANDVLPFPVHAAGKAAWHYFSHYKNHLPHRLYYERLSENMGLPEDTIVENSGLDLQVNHTKAIFNLKQVIRRYVEPERVVICYSAIAQPVEFASKPVWGFDFREWGCMVLRKPTTLDADGFSVLKSCYFITPSFHGNANAGASDGASEDGSEERDAIIGDLTEFVLSSTAATMGAWLQMIENILVVEQAGSAPPPR